MSEQYYVEIVETATDEVVKSLGPHSERSAERIERGVEINLNTDRFHVRMRPASAVEVK